MIHAGTYVDSPCICGGQAFEVGIRRPGVVEFSARERPHTTRMFFRVWPGRPGLKRTIMGKMRMKLLRVRTLKDPINIQFKKEVVSGFHTDINRPSGQANRTCWIHSAFSLRLEVISKN